MTPAFEKLQQSLKRLPGIGFRSSERIALHLLLGKPEQLQSLVTDLKDAAASIRRCEKCGNLSEEALCSLCSNPRREQRSVCVVENVPDLVAIEKSGSWKGLYHVLHGKLSPLHGVGPADLNAAGLIARTKSGEIDELVLALSNDVEGEATCHFLQDQLSGNPGVRITRIGFGIPSGGGVLYADSVTLRSALESRRTFA